MTCSASIINYL